MSSESSSPQLCPSLPLLSACPSPTSPLSSWPASSRQEQSESSRSTLRRPQPAQPACLPAKAGRLTPRPLDSRFFCPAFLHAPTIGPRRATLARAPNSQCPHFDSKAATPFALASTLREPLQIHLPLHHRTYPQQSTRTGAPIAPAPRAIYTWLSAGQFRFSRPLRCRQPLFRRDKLHLFLYASHPIPSHGRDTPRRSAR